MKDKIFCGNAREIKSKEDIVFGYSMQIDLTAIKNNPEWIKTWKDKNGVEHKMVNLKAIKLRDEHKTANKTHYVEIDTWIPEKKDAAQNDEAVQDVEVINENEIDELPF